MRNVPALTELFVFPKGNKPSHSSGRFYSSGEQAEPPPRCVNASSQDERCEDPLLYLNGLGCDHVYVARKGPLCVWRVACARAQVTTIPACRALAQL